MPEASTEILDLVQNASPVVKAVMALLALSSIWCWGIIIQCLISAWRLNHALARHKRGAKTTLVENIFSAGKREAGLKISGESGDAGHLRVMGNMHRRIQELIEREQGGLSNLAVIASVAPFIGLFGTVWGIMGSFIGIASAKDTSLAVVAPGIAEALAATAMGLAAAIPAAFAYNRFAASYTRIGRRLTRYVDDNLPRILGDISNDPKQHSNPMEG